MVESYRSGQVLRMVTGSEELAKILLYLLYRDEGRPMQRDDYEVIAGQMHTSPSKELFWMFEKIHKAAVLIQPENAHLWLEVIRTTLATQVFNETFWVGNLWGMFAAGLELDKECSYKLPETSYQSALPSIFAQILCVPVPQSDKMSVGTIESAMWDKLWEAIRTFFHPVVWEKQFSLHRHKRALQVLHYIGNSGKAQNFGQLNSAVLKKFMHITMDREPISGLLDGARGFASSLEHN